MDFREGLETWSKAKPFHCGFIIPDPHSLLIHNTVRKTKSLLIGYRALKFNEVICLTFQVASVFVLMFEKHQVLDMALLE